MMAFSIVIVLFTGKHTIDIEGRPTRTQWFVLAAAMLVLPSAGAVGWLVSRIHLAGSRMVASAVSVAIAVLGAIMGGPSSRIVVNLLVSGISIAVVLALTASGAGSILAWAVQMTASNLALMATLIARALPVVLLTVLVFFNGYVWLMAAIVSRPRLWLAIAFLVAIAEAFVASAPRNGCSRCCRRRASPRRMTSGWPTRRSRGSPAGRGRHGLSRGERWNVVFVLAVSQTVQVGIVAVMTAGNLFRTGSDPAQPQLLAEWTRNGSSYGQILGMTFPVPQALIQTSLFLGALTFMYLSARAAGDADYRKRFLDPLIDDPKVVFSPAAEFGGRHCAGHWRHRHRGRLPSLPAHALSLAPRNTCASMWWKGAVSQRSKKFL